MRKHTGVHSHYFPMPNRKRDQGKLSKPARMDGLAAHTLGVKLRIPRRSTLEIHHCERERHASLNAALSAAPKT
jgi:hypothetical protein